jgi:putative ABC transport system permease protein
MPSSGGDLGVRTAFYYWRATRRRSRRSMLVVALSFGLLGMVALGGLAGARRTDSAYGRYLASINSSDVFVNVPGPALPVIQQVERLPGVVSGGAVLGLNGEPVVRGKVIVSWVTNALEGSLDGAYFRQDRMTALSGRLPRPGATSEVALTPGLARFFGVTVGGHVTYQLTRRNPRTNAFTPAGRSTFVVTGVVQLPPALGDQFDQVEAAVLPPAATARYLNGEFQFGWVGLRLRAGSAGIPALERRLVVLAGAVDRAFRAPPGAIRLNIRRLDTVHHEVQQEIAPQAVALAVFGGLAALALLALIGQGMAQMLSRSSADLAGLRAAGAVRAQVALAIAMAGAEALVVGMALALVGAVAVSPLAPVGPVRQFDPARGPRADPLVLVGGVSVLAILLFGILGVLAWRAALPAGGSAVWKVSPAAAAVAAAGLPVTALVGTRQALERGRGRQPVPVLATLAGSAVAILAVVMAVVFGASLDGLVTHPARYGWNWTLMMETQGGYGSWPPAVMVKAVNGQPGVTGWSTFAFTQIPIDNQMVPVLGLTRYQGSVEPPTSSGHPIDGPAQIELGAITLRQLGKRIGDAVTVGAGRARRTLTIVGTVTLPSMGLALADHVSLGRGAMLDDGTLLALQSLSRNLPAQRQANFPVSFPAFPSAVAIDLAPGASGTALVARIGAVKYFGYSPGATYRQRRVLGGAIVNASQMGSQPLALALALAAGAVLSLVLALLASVRQQRRELALLKALGLTRRQVGAAVAWQASLILVIATLVGVPLGVAAGRWAWAAFATSLGVVPVTVVPALGLLLGFLGLLAAGNLLAVGPGTVAARTPAAAVLRTE